MNDTAASSVKIDDPRSKYPKPPFREQTQSWPGLATKMDPKPDYGETSYRGADRLIERKLTPSFMAFWATAPRVRRNFFAT
jgi:hypothetical protein